MQISLVASLLLICIVTAAVTIPSDRLHGVAAPKDAHSVDVEGFQGADTVDEKVEDAPVVDLKDGRRAKVLQKEEDNEDKSSRMKEEDYKQVILDLRGQIQEHKSTIEEIHINELNRRPDLQGDHVEPVLRFAWKFVCLMHASSESLKKKGKKAEPLVIGSNDFVADHLTRHKVLLDETIPKRVEAMQKQYKSQQDKRSQFVFKGVSGSFMSSRAGFHRQRPPGDDLHPQEISHLERMDPIHLVGEFDQSSASRKLIHYFDYTKEMDSDDARLYFDYERVKGDLYFAPSDDEELSSCRCEYPDEGIYPNPSISFGRGSSARNFSPLGRRGLAYKLQNSGQSGGPAPTPTETTDPCQVDTFKIKDGKTVLPSCHHACRGVKYVCPDEKNLCQLWTFDCASLPSTDARRLALHGTGALTKNRLSSARQRRRRKSKTSHFTSTGSLFGEVGGDKRGLLVCNRPVVKLPEDHALCLAVDLDDPVGDCGPTISHVRSSQTPVKGGVEIDREDGGYNEIEGKDHEFGFEGFREEGNEEKFNFDELRNDKSKIGGGCRESPEDDLSKDRSNGFTGSSLMSVMPSSRPSNEPSTSLSPGPSARSSSSQTELDMNSRPPILMPSGVRSESPAAPKICVEDVQVVPLDLNSTSMDFAKVVYIPIGAERVTIEFLLFLPKKCEEQMYIAIDDTVLDLGETHRSECTSTGAFEGIAWSRTGLQSFDAHVDVAILTIPASFYSEDGMLKFGMLKIIGRVSVDDSCGLELLRVTSHFECANTSPGPSFYPGDSSSLSSPDPSTHPSLAPSSEPPSSSPTPQPTDEPTPAPTGRPTPVPTDKPIPRPKDIPTAKTPSTRPTNTVTSDPTAKPTPKPTVQPVQPTDSISVPSLPLPSSLPSSVASETPSSSISSESPTFSPSATPMNSPKKRPRIKASAPQHTSKKSSKKNKKSSKKSRKRRVAELLSYREPELYTERQSKQFATRESGHIDKRVVQRKEDASA